MQQVNLFTNNPNLSGNINAGTNYSWNITAQSLSLLMNVQLQVTVPGMSGFTTLTAPIANGSVAGIVAALNSLNVGFFYSTVIGGQTYIQSGNSKFAYGSLTVNQAGSYWIVSGSSLTTSSGTLATMAMQVFDINSSTIIGGCNSSGVPPLPGVSMDTNFFYPSSILADGDTLHFDCYGDATIRTFTVLIVQNGVTLLNSNTNVSSVAFQWFHILNATYKFVCTIN